MGMYNEFRPETFDDIFGQDNAVKLFKSILKLPFEKRPKVFLLAGASGSGKTCLARIYANEMGVNPDGMDFRTLDASKDRSIDRIRAEAELMGTSPMSRKAECRVYYIDECFSYETLITCVNEDGTLYKASIGSLVANKTRTNVLSVSPKGVLEPKPIVNWFRNKKKPVKNYTFQRDGYGHRNALYKIACTDNHKLLAKSGEWVTAGTLKEGDQVQVTIPVKINPIREMNFSYGRTELHTASLISIEDEKEWQADRGAVYDIEVADNHNYIAGGVVAHNCHQLLKASQEALLKVCEDVPPKTTVIFATTEPEKLGKALKSRCKIVTINALSNRDMALNMVHVANKTNIQINTDDVKKLVIASDGNTRTSIQLLENYMLNGGNADSAVAMVDVDKRMEADVRTLCQNIIKSGARWDIVKSFMQNYKGQHEQVRQAIIAYFKACVLNSNKMADRQRFNMYLECFLQTFYGSEEAGLVYQLANAWDLK